MNFQYYINIIESQKPILELFTFDENIKKEMENSNISIKNAPLKRKLINSMVSLAQNCFKTKQEINTEAFLKLYKYHEYYLIYSKFSIPNELYEKILHIEFITKNYDFNNAKNALQTMYLETDKHQIVDILEVMQNCEFFLDIHPLENKHFYMEFICIITQTNLKIS